VGLSGHVDFAADHCQIIIYRDVIRIFLHEFFIEIEGCIIIAGGIVCPSEIQDSVGIFLVYGMGFLQGVYRVGYIPKVKVADAQIAENAGIIRGNRQCPAKIRKGFHRLAKFFLNDREPVQGIQVVGIFFNTFWKYLRLESRSFPPMTSIVFILPRPPVILSAPPFVYLV